MGKMSKADLDAIRDRCNAAKSRCNAATPPPWTSQPYDDLWEVTPVARGQDYGVFEEADAEFTAHAREDVPALIAVIEWLLRLVLG